MNSPVTLLNAAILIGAGNSFLSKNAAYPAPSLEDRTSNYIYSVVVTYLTAAPTAATVVLEGSLDDINWIPLGNTTDVSALNVAFFVSNKPFINIRGNLTAYTAGTNTGVTVKCGVAI